MIDRLSRLVLLVVVLATAAILGRLHGDGGHEAAPSTMQQAAVPPHIKALIDWREGRPPWELVARLRPDDKATLAALYRKTPALVDRRALTWGLAQVGDGEAAEVLKGTLTAEFGGKALPRSEEDVLLDTVLALGLIGGRSDSAYAMVKQGTDLGFWREKRGWSSPRGDYSDRMLVSLSIQAVALSGRSDVPATLDSLKKKDRAYLHNFAGDIVQGAFYEYLRAQGGREAVLRHVQTPDDRRPFEEWMETPDGKAWVEWANEQMRGPAPGNAL